MKFPRQFNALQVARILGPECFKATVETASNGVADFFGQRGRFSYDPSRRRIPALVSGHMPFSQVIEEVSTHGQPLGRKWNVELIDTIRAEYEVRRYSFRPIKLQFRPVVDGLVLRIPCNFFIVESGAAIFQLLQLGRGHEQRLGVQQVRFVLSAAQHTLAKDDLAGATSQLGDLSKRHKKGQREPSWTFLSEVGCASRDELNAVLQIFKEGYIHALTNQRLPTSAYRQPRGWEEDQYRLL